jgi:hypothetical protein
MQLHVIIRQAGEGIANKKSSAHHFTNQGQTGTTGTFENSTFDYVALAVARDVQYLLSQHHVLERVGGRLNRFRVLKEAFNEFPALRWCNSILSAALTFHKTVDYSARGR